MKSSIEALRASPELYRVFAEEIPRDRRRALGADRAPRGHVWADLDPQKMFRGIPDPELAGFIARTAASAVLHEASITRPELLDNALFFEELVTLLERYLTRAGDAASPGKARQPRGERSRRRKEAGQRPVPRPVDKERM